MGNSKRKKHKKPTTMEGRKRAHIYRELDDKPELPDGDFDPEGYEYFKSVKWDAAWKEFLELKEDGTYKHQTSWGLIKHLVPSGKEKDEQRKWLYAAIGPRDKSVKKKPVPYLGDWSYNRACLFTGELKTESLLYGNPKVIAVREMVKNNIDALKISQSFGELLMGWMARYDTWATQIDERFKYNLFDPKLSDEKNERRFAQYTKMQEYMFNRTIDCTRQILKCFGVGKDDVSLLTQMMIAGMRNRLGDGVANMMMASASGVKVIEGGGMNTLPVEVQGDNSTIAGAEHMLENNPQLKMMFGTFIGKSQMYRMEQPDLNIPGVPKDDTSTDPRKDPAKLKATGHVNGKVKSVN